MPSFFPPKRGVEYIFYISLAAQAQANTFQSSPTLAAGDFKVSIDGGALANPATLPTVTPAASKMVKVTLSASEMTGDNITLICSDAAGAEWRDLTVNIQTSAQQIDDLATVGDIPTASAIADAVLDDALTEPAAAFTWAGATLRTIVGWLGALSRNKVLQTSVTSTLRNDADSGSISTSTVSDSGSELIRGEWT